MILKANSFQIHTRGWLSAILALFFALGVLYSIVTPIFEASDEVWHYPVVQYISAGKGLPVQTPSDNPGLWKQEASQPPLYYVLTGWLTAWIDTGDLGDVLRPNPHGALGVVTPDGNVNMVVHDPAHEAWPWRGTVLAVHLARLLSVLMSTVAVYLTYRLARMAFPARPEIALGAAAFNAFTPMFLFISGSVNNDNLVIPLCALALWLMGYQNEHAHDCEARLMWGWVLLGVVIGLATLAKVSALALLPLSALSGALVAWQRRKHSAWAAWRHLFAAGVAIGLPVLLLTGWWFWRNLNLYGDVLGFAMFTPYFTRAVPADLAQIWSERTSFLYGYWGNFGGLNVPIPEWAYVLFNVVLILAAVGSFVRLTFKRLNFNVQRSFPVLLLSLWGALVFVSWLNWTHTTWSSQGRLVFSAIPAYSILIVAGLAALLPRRVAPYALGALSVAMALFAAVLPFAVIAPAYARPPELTLAEIEAIPQRVDANFGDGLTLLGYAAPDVSMQPGDSTRITLYWQAQRALDKDYSLFVHLLDENDVEVQDKGPAYPGRGLLPVTTLAPGQTWAETWVVPLRATAFAPAHLRWEIGVYDAASGVRLPVVDQSGQTVGDNVRFDAPELLRPAGFAFNPTAYNFGNELELIGFDLDRRAASPGQTITLNLVWRAPDVPTRDYTVFAHILELSTLSKWAGLDQQPLPSTSSWQPGQIVTQTFPLTLNPEAVPGVYDIEVGVYYFTDEANIERLNVIARDGRQQQDFVLLSKVRVTR